MISKLYTVDNGIRERVLHQPASQAIVLADGAPSMDAFEDVRNIQVWVRCRSVESGHAFG
jgi:hypothetical protein